MIKTLYLNKKGYTLIEMIIVLAVISLLLPMIFSVMYVILRQQIKIYRVVETKREGDRIMLFIKEKVLREAYMIRDSAGIERCILPNVPYSDTPNLVFKKGPNATDASFAFYLSGESIFFNDFITLNTPLNKSTVRITTFNVSCNKRTVDHSPLIDISFTIFYNDPTITAEEGNVSFPYRTKIRLRQ